MSCSNILSYFIYQSLYLLLLAGAILHEIRVVMFSVEPAMGDDEGESVIHESTIASIVEGLVAVNELLL